MLQDLLVLIDGNSSVHRAYHAVRPLSTAAGCPTNAVYGFTSTLIQLLKKERPQKIAVAFDLAKKNFRHDLYPAYKAHRQATPEDLQAQFPLVKEIVRAFGVTLCELEGYEADDILGALSALAEQNGQQTLIITGDRDLLQLVSPLTKVLMPQRGAKETELYDEAKVIARYGLAPAQLTDLKGLAGDASDNIPGVKGVGEKTALKLLKEYGSLEGVIANVDHLSGRLKQLVSEGVPMAELSKQLGTIRRDLPLGLSLAQCLWRGPDYGLLWPLFQQLEFRSLSKTVAFDFIPQPAGLQNPPVAFDDVTPPSPAIEYNIIEGKDQIEAFAALALRSECLYLAVAGDSHRGLEAVGFSLSGQAYLLPIPAANPEKEPALALLESLMGNETLKKYCCNAKETIKLLCFHGFKIRNLCFDLILAAYLLNPTAPNKSVGDVARTYLASPLPADALSLPHQAELLRQLAADLAGKLRQDGSYRLFTEIELPLAEVLARMERQGVAVDERQLRQMSASFGATLESLALEIYNLAGSAFNLNSSKQLGQILFEVLKLPVVKKTKTGYSTDAAVLEKLAGEHAIVAKILDYRQVAKLKSTYTDGLAPLINPQTGRLHTTFHQAVTATGRLSSSDPNLQNIPVRLELGRQIRKVFIPSQPGNLLLTADYSQIELRILAHLSADPVLIAAFINGEDIHARTASEILGIPLDQVSPEARQRAKAVNFGIVYGLSDFGLARDLKIPRREAKNYIESYFTRYQGVKRYMEQTVAAAHAQGYVTTLLNRRRYLPELQSRNQLIRSASERTAINTPVQGSAADIIKLAMLNVSRALEENQLEAKMILQVHDELIFDVPETEVEQLRRLVQENMERAYQLKVPLVVVLNTGANWYEAK